MSEHFRPSITLHELFVKLQTDAFKTMRLLSEVVEIILTIFASNAEVERIWSSITHILDDKSLSIGQETLEYCLQIKKSKVSLDNFDPTDAVNLWWSDTVRSRQPDFTK